MNSPPATREQWAESTSALAPPLEDNRAVFDSLFERSADAIWLYEVYDQTVLLVDCNQAAVELIGAKSKKEVLHMRPEELSPPLQPDGLASAQKTIEVITTVQRQKTHRFEWMIRRLDGSEVPVEVSATVVRMNGKDMHVAISRDVRERKKAERELRELTQALERRVSERTAALSASEAKFRALFEGSSQGVVLHDEHQILEVNPAAVRIMGRQSPHELLGKHPREMAPPFQPNGESSGATATRYIEECLTKGSARFDWVARTTAGQDIFLEVALTRIEWSGRQVIQAFITDITERKRAQTALAESEARFSAAFHASHALIGILRVSDGKYVLVNDAHLNWLGYAREEVLGRTCLELGMWVDTAERDCLLKDMGALGSIRQRECRWRNRRGGHFTVLLSAETITINDTPHMLLMALDITQRKRAEEELRASETRLRESEARFSAAFHSSPIITGICRASDRQFVLVNDASLEWAGYNREDVLGHTSIELRIWENPEDRERMWDDARRSGSVRGRECRLRNRYGRVSTMLASGAMIEINGEDHLLVMVVDISQRKHVEAELHKTLVREKELSQLKSNFVSMVSHEFRTPLGIIQSSAELLRDFHERMQSSERQDQLDSISRNSRRMAAMMEEVLVLSRLDAGKLIFQPAQLDLNIFCRRVVDEVRSATNRRCFIELCLNSVPSDGEADERLLGHIFTNLLSNAVKYSDPGATVQFAVDRDGCDAVCVFRDRGIGIPEEDQQQLFEAFHRGGNVGTRPGTGLGLLLVKRCAELHGGNVRVSSRIGEGTTVTVRLPVFGANHEKDIGH
jgi:PAS domain S-box-containing protein